MRGLGEVPIGWAWASLEDLATSDRGAITDGPFGSNLKTAHYTSTGPRVIRLQNIGDGEFIDERAHIAEGRFERLRRHEAVAGDVVLAMLGGMLPRACVVPTMLGPAIVKADCARLRLHPALVASMYVSFCLNSESVRKRVATIVHGVGRPRISLSEVKALRIPVAPRPEQDRIVAALEQQLSRIDAGVDALKRAKANLERYRASVLKAACEGRLVPSEAELARAEGRSYEPASDLLARILKERRKRWEADQLARMKARGKPPKDDAWKKKYPEPAAPDTSALPELPEGWCWATVSQLLSEPLMNGLSIKGADSPPGVPALKLNALWAEGLDFGEVRYLPVDWIKVSDLCVRQGDFLLARGNGSLRLVGRGTVAARPPCDLIFPDTVIRLRAAEPIRQTGWLPAIWSSTTLRSQIERAAKTTAGIWKVSQQDVGDLNLPLPPLAEQRCVRQELDRLLSSAGRIASGVSAAASRASRLRQSLLAHAFSGKLVPQDPSDESASVLLERIRKEREAEAGSPAPRKPGRAKRGRV